MAPMTWHCSHLPEESSPDYGLRAIPAALLQSQHLHKTARPGSSAAPPCSACHFDKVVFSRTSFCSSNHAILGGARAPGMLRRQPSVPRAVVSPLLQLLSASMQSWLPAGPTIGASSPSRAARGNQAPLLPAICFLPVCSTRQFYSSALVSISAQQAHPLCCRRPPLLQAAAARKRRPSAPTIAGQPATAGLPRRPTALPTWASSYCKAAPAAHRHAWPSLPAVAVECPHRITCTMPWSSRPPGCPTCGSWRSSSSLRGMCAAPRGHGRRSASAS